MTAIFLMIILSNFTCSFVLNVSFNSVNALYAYPKHNPQLMNYPNISKPLFPLCGVKLYYPPKHVLKHAEKHNKPSN